MKKIYDAPEAHIHGIGTARVIANSLNLCDSAAVANGMGDDSDAREEQTTTSSVWDNEW